MTKLYRRNYRRPMLRNIGRFYRSTDASNIAFILATSGEILTQVLQSAQSEAGLFKGSYEHANRYSRDQRTDTPLAQIGLRGATQGLFSCILCGTCLFQHRISS